MERKIEKYLIKWKGSSRRMPLLINGARQVGKTYSALTFGKVDMITLYPLGLGNLTVPLLTSGAYYLWFVL